MPAGLQQSGPHLLSPPGQTHWPPLATCLPGHLTGVGVGVGRRAALVSLSCSALPSAAAPPIPTNALTTDRRDAPEASNRASRSKRHSSIFIPYGLRHRTALENLRTVLC